MNTDISKELALYNAAVPKKKQRASKMDPLSITFPYYGLTHEPNYERNLYRVTGTNHRFFNSYGNGSGIKA